MSKTPKSPASPASDKEGKVEKVVDLEKEDAKLIEKAEAASKEVTTLLSQGNTKGALSLCLADPPISAKGVNAKKIATEAALHVFSAYKDTDIPKAVEALSAEEVDICLKYVYKGFAKADATAGSLLKWHAALYAKGGNGSIVRAVVDKRTI